MPDLPFSFTLTPALIATAVIYDLALIALGIALVRRLRSAGAGGASSARRGARLFIR